MSKSTIDEMRSCFHMFNISQYDLGPAQYKMFYTIQIIISKLYTGRTNPTINAKLTNSVKSSKIKEKENNYGLER